MQNKVAARAAVGKRRIGHLAGTLIMGLAVWRSMSACPTPGSMASSQVVAAKLSSTPTPQACGPAAAVRKLRRAVHMAGVGVHRQVTAVLDRRHLDAPAAEMGQVGQVGVLVAMHERPWH